jgi:hypothetical protein
VTAWAIDANGTDQGGDLPVTGRSGCDAALASGTASPQALQAGARPGFVDEHQLFHWNISKVLVPGRTLCLDILPLLLSGMDRLFSRQTHFLSMRQ